MMKNQILLQINEFATVFDPDHFWKTFYLSKHKYYFAARVI